MSDPRRDVRLLPQRIETDAESVQRDLLRLVLTVVELVRAGAPVAAHDLLNTDLLRFADVAGRFWNDAATVHCSPPPSRRPRLTLRGRLYH